MSKAASAFAYKLRRDTQGFLLRRTGQYAADRNPRRTPLIGKRTISGLETN